MKESDSMVVWGIILGGLTLVGLIVFNAESILRYILVGLLK